MEVELFAKLKADAKQTLERQSTKQLVEGFAETDRQMTEDIKEDDRFAIIGARGWIMDELERRKPTDFAAWLDTPEMSIADLRRLFIG